MPASVTAEARTDVLVAHTELEDRSGASAGDHRPRIGTLQAAQPVSQVRGVLAEHVIISTTLDPYLSLTALAGYSGISVRKLRDCLVDPGHPLPHYRVGGTAGKIVVRRSEFDAWMAQYRRVGEVDVSRLVDDVIRDLR